MADEDGNIHLPAAVRAKIAEGTRLFEAQKSQPQPPPQARQEAAAPGVPQAMQEMRPTHPSPQMPSAEPAPPEVVVADPAVDDQQQQGQQEDGSSAGLQRQLSQAEQRYRTLQGRMRLELGNRDNQIAEMQKAINNATSQIAELTARVLTTQSTPGAPQNKDLTRPSKVASITDAERNDYGEPFFDMVGRLAQEIADRTIAERLSAVETKYDALGNKLEQNEKTVRLNKDQRRESWLDTNLMGWRETDNDPGFLDWLHQEDVGTGFPRIAILKKAMDDENYPRIKLIFEGYGQELGVIAPPPPPRPNGRARLAAQAMPNGGNGRVDAIAPDTPEAPPTPEEIAEYFHRKIHRPKSLTEAEITRFEGRMRTGLATGTIRGQPRV